MKQLTKSIFLLLIVLFISSCSSKKEKRNPNFLKPLIIEIPDDVKNDTELVDIIESSEKAINEFSDNIEQLAIDGKELLSKNEKDYSLTEGLKAGKLMLQFVSNSTQMATVFEEFNSYIESKRAQGIINDEQLVALSKVGKSFEERIDQINEKYKDYFN